MIFNITDLGKQHVSWTAVHSTNAWLALDRNNNGVIDSGSELFGNITPQPSPPAGKPKNGFLALSVFDDPKNGGNGDGVIDQRDSIYLKLLLWQDKNHNGISEPDELRRLSDFNITSIGLHYTEARYTDRFGNIFRYRSKLRRDNSENWTYDVLLLPGRFQDETSTKLLDRGVAWHAAKFRTLLRKP